MKCLEVYTENKGKHFKKLKKSTCFGLEIAIFAKYAVYKLDESDQKRSRKHDDTVFPAVTLSVAMETSSRIWPNFELIQALMHVIITCKYEKDPIKIAAKM